MKFSYLILLSLIVSAGLEPISRSVYGCPCSDYTDIYSSYFYPENPCDIPSTEVVTENTAVTTEDVRELKTFRY